MGAPNLREEFLKAYIRKQKAEALLDELYAKNPKRLPNDPADSAFETACAEFTDAADKYAADLIAKEK